MKNLKFVLIPTLLLSIMYCKPQPDYNQMTIDIQKEIEQGSIKDAIKLADSLKSLCSNDRLYFLKADSLKQIAERIAIDFCITEDDVIMQIKEKTGQFSHQEKNAWEKKGWLEWRLINGKKMYFKRSVSNLALIQRFHEHKGQAYLEAKNDPDKVFRLKHSEKIIKTSGNLHSPVIPVNMRITYTLTVKSDVIPEGETIRCWLPWPKGNQNSQKDVKLLSASNKEYIIAPDTAIHSSLYMEGIAKKGIPTIFKIVFLYQSSGQYFNLDNLKILPYDNNYIDMTYEKLPQISFTDNIKRLTDSITSSDDNPVVTVKKIYSWIKENITWTGALEYSIMPNIPEYVYHNKRGDCGMQTFLFMSMLRYKGIPVRWQSGWMVPPGNLNLHDWCEVYYAGPGWVPVDVSYDLQHSNNQKIKEFYASGIDSYRMIVNTGISGTLHPEKQYLRSEPYDFQRGEVEWKEGNLYFDKWEYKMEIEYLK
jgi:Transglutaminase-like superfamily